MWFSSTASGSRTVSNVAFSGVTSFAILSCSLRDDSMIRLVSEMTDSGVWMNLGAGGGVGCVMARGVVVSIRGLMKVRLDLEENRFTRDRRRAAGASVMAEKRKTRKEIKSKRRVDNSARMRTGG